MPKEGSEQVPRRFEEGQGRLVVHHAVDGARESLASHRGPQPQLEGQPKEGSKKVPRRFLEAPQPQLEGQPRLRGAARDAERGGRLAEPLREVCPLVAVKAAQHLEEGAASELRMSLHAS